MTRYPNLYSAVGNENGKILQLISNSANGPRWNFTFRQRLDLIHLTELHNLLHDIPIPNLSDAADSISWRPNGIADAYTVRKQVAILEAEHPINAWIVPVKKVWSKMTTPKDNFLVWQAFIDRLPTTDRLRHFGMSVNPICPFYRDRDESVEHIFLICNFINNIWSELRREFHCNPWSTNSFQEAVTSWNLTSGTKIGWKIWYCLLQATCWVIWNERNGRTFGRENFLGCNDAEYQETHLELAREKKGFQRYLHKLWASFLLRGIHYNTKHLRKYTHLHLSSLQSSKRSNSYTTTTMKRAAEDITTSSAAAKKPVFLTKAQREQLSLQRREEEAAEQKRLSEQLLRLIKPSSDRSPPRDSSRHHRDRERERERERDSERRHRERQREEEIRSRELARSDKQSEREKEKVLEAIKEQYLRTKKPKKRVIKSSEKFRFSFDWENTEDTSLDINTLYQNPVEAHLLFGRGFRAGMDRREQKKLAAENEKRLRQKIREKEGVAESPKEAAAHRQREEAADVYGTFDMRVDRHWTEKKLEEMTERDWRIFREDYNISYKGSKIPKPMRNWAESRLTPELLKAVEKVGYKTPSPIQMAAIPLGLQQRDVIGIAETGSGKTAAFVLPMLTYISRLPPITKQNEAEGPYAVVMAPTRELAQQIEDETVKFARYLGIKVVSIVGGQSIEEQGFKIQQGCEVVIATPGRLIDCLERRYAVLNQCNYVVLDEADRMIDMGFEPQVVGVLDAMPSSNLKPENEDEELDEKRIYRTTYMFSATMPTAVERLARKYLRNPVVVTIGTAGKATDLITQHVVMLKESEKMPRLQKLLDDLGDKTAIVFVNTKKSADSLSKSLDKLGFHVTTLHGGKSQEQREISLEGFRNKRFNVLVATDVAGRGIDIPDVAHVINYDMPANIEMYTHRIGRTGRAGKTGVATTFLTLHDTDVFYDLKQMLLSSNSPVPPELARHEASKFKPGTIPDRPPRRNATVFTH